MSKGQSIDKASKAILELIGKEGISIGEIADRIGISRQAMYKRLEGNMSTRSFYEVVEELGYEVRFEKI